MRAFFLRFRGWFAAIAVLAAIAGLGVALLGDEADREVVAGATPSANAAPDDTANLFVVVGGGDGLRSDARVAFADSAAPDHRFGSISQAYAAARPGDRILVKGGDYKALDQCGTTVGCDRALNNTALNDQDDDVLVEVFPGDSVDYPELKTGNTQDEPPGSPNAGAQHLTLRRGAGKAFRINVHLQQTLDVTLDGIDSTIAPYVRASEDILIDNSDFGPWHNQTVDLGTVTFPANPACPSLCRRGVTNLTIEDSVYHDLTFDEGAHADFISTGKVDGFVLRRVQFKHCAHYCVIFATDANGEAIKNAVVENNMFGLHSAEGGGGDFSIGDTDGPVMFRFNSVGGSFNTTTGGTIAYDELTIDSNVFGAPNPTCTTGDGEPTWTHNVWPSGEGCGSDATIGRPAFVRNTVLDSDLHLTAGSAARNAGNPANLPDGGTDLDGDKRDSATPDAGADEFGSR